MNKINLLIYTALFIVSSCNKDDDSFGEQNTTTSTYAIMEGIYITNEGNFNSGNSSISFLSLDPLTMESDIFYHQNERPLGDVAQHIAIHNGLAYIVVNNSGKIEVVRLDDFSSVATIDGLNSPRYMQIVNDNKAFVTSLYSDSLVVIDLKSNTISGYLNVGTSSNTIIESNGKLFVANWLGRELIIADTSNALISTMDITKEPNSMAVDKDGNVWVLSSGGWDHEEKAALTVVNSKTNNVLKKIEFADNQASPSRLVMNGTKDTLYFINKHIYQMSIYDDGVPNNPLINGDGHLYYGLLRDYSSSLIYVTDAIDYMQSGLLYRYSTAGAKIDSFPTGVIPGEMAISQTYYTASQNEN